MGASWRYFRCPPGGQCSIGADTLAGRYSTGANKLAEPLLICANTKGLFNHDLAIADDLTEFVKLRAHKGRELIGRAGIDLVSGGGELFSQFTFTQCGLGFLLDAYQNSGGLDALIRPAEPPPSDCVFRRKVAPILLRKEYELLMLSWSPCIRRRYE